MGGYIALALQRMFPERVDGLVLVSTRAGPDNDEGKQKRNDAIALAEKSGVSAIVASMLPKMMAPVNAKKDAVVKALEQVMLKTSLQGVIGDLTAMRDRMDATPFLSRIDVPTLVIHGADDALIPVSEAEALAKAIPDAQLNVMADCGHMPSIEQPQAFNRALTAFVKFVADDEETQH
jgi:pimeloyl-ACP methyl ester carboxylesterase